MDQQPIAVTLPIDQWTVLEFLARRGAMHEIEHALINPYAHKPQCSTGFVDACQALQRQLRDQPLETPQLPPTIPITA